MNIMNLDGKDMIRFLDIQPYALAPSNTVVYSITRTLSTMRMYLG